MVKKFKALKKSAKDFFFDPVLCYLYGAFSMLLFIHLFS